MPTGTQILIGIVLGFLFMVGILYWFVVVMSKIADWFKKRKKNHQWDNARKKIIKARIIDCPQCPYCKNELGGAAADLFVVEELTKYGIKCAKGKQILNGA